MNEITDVFVQRGDLAHLALFLWAISSSAMLFWALKELAVANKRFDHFVNEITAINKLFKRNG